MSKIKIKNIFNNKHIGTWYYHDLLYIILYKYMRLDDNYNL